MSRIRHRIVALALVLTLLPAVPLSLLTAKLLDRSAAVQTDDTLVRALDAGLDETRETLAREKRNFVARVEQGALSNEDRSWSWARGDEIPHDMPPEVRRWAADAEAAGEPGIVGDALALRMDGPGDATRVFVSPLPAGLVTRASRITDAHAFLNVLRTERERVLRGYFLPFVLAYGLLALVAIVTGSVVAGRLARPLETLAATAEKTSLANIDTEVPRTDRGEVGDLQVAFNRMVRRISAQKDDLSRLERLAAWREIAQSLAHEIKNPLTPIQLAVQELRDRYPGGDDRYGSLLADCGEIVDEEVASLRRLVREFSEFARLPVPEKKPRDPYVLLQELAKLYGERVSVDCEAGTRVSFDASEMKRALINLVDNGLAACADAGRPEQVALRGRSRGETFVIEVEDTGTGLSEERRAKIFEPHFTTKTDGMGLGLPIVQGIVFGHGGNIEVESEESVGTTFRLLLPHGPGEETT